MIYLDYAATTPMSEEALYVYQEAARKFFANPSSLHEAGTKAKEALEACRHAWADMLQVEPEGIFFTSGGTEANQLALQSLIEGNKEKGNHLVTTEIEHSSIYNLFEKYASEGYEITYVPLTKDGQVDLQALEKALRPSTILVSIQTVNGETGFIQPIEAIGSLLKEKGILFHTDFVQGFGNVDVSINESSINSLSIASHKFHGPKGVGLTYIDPRVRWKQQIPNTTHESGFRPGTVDVPSILSFTKAGQEAVDHRERKQRKMLKLRRYFLEGLKQAGLDVTIYESKEAQLPQILGLSFGKLQGQYIMLECNKYDIAISTGSACQVGKQSPSRTIRALGKTRDEANQLVRISFGEATTFNDLDRCIEVLTKIVKQ